jgi:hypothetical protein
VLDDDRATTPASGAATSSAALVIDVPVSVLVSVTTHTGVPARPENRRARRLTAIVPNAV